MGKLSEPNQKLLATSNGTATLGARGLSCAVSGCGLCGKPLVSSAFGRRSPAFGRYRTTLARRKPLVPRVGYSTEHLNNRYQHLRAKAVEVANIFNNLHNKHDQNYIIHSIPKLISWSCTSSWLFRWQLGALSWSRTILINEQHK